MTMGLFKGLQFQSVFENSDLIGWVRVNLGCC